MSVEIKTHPQASIATPLEGETWVLNFGIYKGDHKEIRKAAVDFWNKYCRKCPVDTCTAYGIAGPWSIYSGKPNAPNITPIELRETGSPRLPSELESERGVYVVTAGVSILSEHEKDPYSYIRKAACEPQIG